MTDSVKEPGIPGSPTFAATKIPRAASNASPLGRTPTGTLTRPDSSPGVKMPTVFSPRFDVNAKFRRDGAAGNEKFLTTNLTN
jgi:hypothetical protein